MRCFAALLLSVTLLGCDALYTEVPVSGREGVQIVYRGGVYYAEQNGARHKLLTLCQSDCNERMGSNGWAPRGRHYAFHVVGSNRYASGNRLLLVSFAGATPRTLLDRSDERVDAFHFTDTTLVYFMTVQRATFTTSVRLD